MCHCEFMQYQLVRSLLVGYYLLVLASAYTLESSIAANPTLSYTLTVTFTGHSLFHSSHCSDCWNQWIYRSQYLTKWRHYVHLTENNHNRLHFMYFVLKLCIMENSYCLSLNLNFTLQFNRTCYLVSRYSSDRYIRNTKIDILDRQN